jgi:hypothetical protein
MKARRIRSGSRKPVDCATLSIGSLEACTCCLARLEYNPAPPFNSGSPDTAPPEILARMRERIAPFQQRRSEAIGRAAAGLG